MVYKRVAWQAVSNALTGDLWMKDQKGIKNLLKENIDSLFNNAEDSSSFDSKLKLVSIISFLLLEGEI